jgi:ribosomal-protein-alanine N-acetyltransferase
MDLDLGPAARATTVELFVLMPDHVSDAYVAWLNDPEVNRFLESRFDTHTIESTRSFVAAMHASPDNLMLGIRSTALGRHVGNIKLGPISRRHGTGEVGILIGDRAAWGRGIATQAIAALSDIARTRLGLRKVTAGCYATNVGSQRAFEKAGYAVEGCRKAQYLLDGQPEDLVVMGHIL